MAKDAAPVTNSEHVSPTLNSTTHGSDESRQTAPNPATGPAFALLVALSQGRVPIGDLGPATVPAKVLAYPLRLALDALTEHGRTCQKPRCPRIPAPLWPYIRMRPQAIRKTAPDHVYKVLWTEPRHEFVDRVRKRIVRKHVELEKEISNGSLLVGNRLADLLTELGTAAPQIIAAALWATEFAPPYSDTLFRMLVPLAGGMDDPRVATPARSKAGDIRSLEEQLRRAVRSGKEAARKAEQAAHDSEVNRRTLEKTRQELERANSKYREVAEELAATQQHLREAQASLAIAERAAEKSSISNKELRRDLNKLQGLVRDLEVRRSDLAEELGEAEREIKHLAFDLEVTPQGSDATWEFLTAEDERINKDRLILSGGARSSAETEWASHRKLKAAFLEAYPRYRQPPPVKIRPKSALRFSALGGSSEVGRSCYLLELGGRRIMVDCGIKAGSATDMYPAIEQIDGIDALVLTHAHTDHIGWVPALLRRFGEFDIYCSEGTAALLPVMLEDCHRHYLRKIDALRDRAKFIKNAEVPEEQYDEEEVNKVPKLAFACPFGSEEPLPFEGAWITFYRAGHILGAASVLIRDDSGRRIFFSGDFSSFPQLTVPAAYWPEQLGEVDLLVLESTYAGKSAHAPLDESRADLLSFIRDTTQSRQGSVILASFALGRAQELLSLIMAAKKSGDIPASLSVHVDGLIRQINPIYRKRASFAVESGDFNEVSGQAERREVAYESQMKPTIIVTTSGMMTGGPVVEYARQLLPDPRHRIVFAGYQDEGAPSQALIKLDSPGRGARIVELRDEGDEMVRIEAAMPAKHVGLSSHADQPGLLEYAARLRPKAIALVHGQLDGQKELRALLLGVHPSAEVCCGPTALVVP